MANHTLTIEISDKALNNFVHVMLIHGVRVKKPLEFFNLMLQVDLTNDLESYSYMVGEADDILENIPVDIASYEMNEDEE
jgi:hypothetical protein